MKRVLLILDPNTTQPELLETAVQLASAFHAELLVSYLEDENLMRSASLPFTKEINLVTSHKRTLTQANVGFSYRARSSLLSNRIGKVARQQGVSWSFRMIQERYEQHVTTLSDVTDLVILGLQHFALSNSINASLLVAGDGDSRPGYIACIYQPANGDVSAIPAALTLANYYDVPLYMLIVADTDGQILAYKQEIGQAGFQDHKTVWRSLKKISYPEIGRSLRWQRRGMLLCDTQNMLAEEDAKRLIQDLELKIMIKKGNDQ